MCVIHMYYCLEIIQANKYFVSALAMNVTKKLDKYLYLNTRRCLTVPRNKPQKKQLHELLEVAHT